MIPLLVTNLTNIHYLTGVDISWGIVLLARDKHLFVDGRYIERARREGKNDFLVHPLEDLEKHLKRLRTVRFEAHDLTVDRLTRWKKKYRGTKLIPSTNVIEELRRSKSGKELQAIQKACRITDRILQCIPEILKVSSHKSKPPTNLPLATDHWPLTTGFPITEKQMAWIIEQMAHNLDADSLSFETIVAFGSNTSRPHHKPTNRKLRKGDIVQIDMGVKVDGYCSDCSRVFFTGKPTEEQKKIFDLLVRIVKETTTMAKPGTLTSTLDQYARKGMREEGCEKLFLHSLGHGVGLEIHEGANLTSRKGTKPVKLKMNEVITTEPGIYFEGQWGMRIEDTILVMKSGSKPLTHARY